MILWRQIGAHGHDDAAPEAVAESMKEPYNEERAEGTRDREEQETDRHDHQRGHRRPFSSLPVHERSCGKEKGHIHRRDEPKYQPDLCDIKAYIFAPERKDDVPAGTKHSKNHRYQPNGKKACLVVAQHIDYSRESLALVFSHRFVNFLRLLAQKELDKNQQGDRALRVKYPFKPKILPHDAADYRSEQSGNP